MIVTSGFRSLPLRRTWSRAHTRNVSFQHIARPARSLGSRRMSLLATGGICLGATIFSEHTSTPTRYTSRGVPIPPKEPESIVNIYQLSFGSVAGICVGVFVKKGLKAIAFFSGGIFVLLQYMVSRSFVKVDWGKLGSRYENAVDTAAGAAGRKQSRSVAIWHRFTDFLLADFPPRATFLAGMALGLRIG